MTPIFHCMKLVNGETIITEILEYGQDTIVISNPFVTKTGEDESHMMATPWIPFVDQNRIVLRLDQVCLSAPLTNRYKQFYGVILLQSKISEIKSDIMESADGPADYYKIMEGIARIRETANEINNKFGGVADVNIEDFEKQAEKLKPLLN